MDIKLAIIIPTYDSLDTLKVLIKQIFKHTKGDFQVYVIEDGQKPETIKYLKNTKYPLKVIYHKFNKGVAVSWNDGLKQAKKDGCTHFAILNDDIEVPKDWWVKCKEQFDKGFNLVCLDEPCPIPLTGWFFAFDRQCLDKVGYFDEQFTPYCAEDDDYFIRFKSSGLKFTQINLAVLHHGSSTLKKLSGVKSVIRENWRRLRLKYPKLRMQQI